VPQDDPTLRHDFPPWAPVLQAFGLLLFHGLVPLGLSRLSFRHGWVAGHPAAGNLVGLLLVGGGLALILWLVVLHDTEAPKHGWRMERTPFEPTRYLIVWGPYGYSRNPIYLSHFTIWLGWSVFYGSIAIALGIVVMWVVLAFVIVPYEERGLVRQLGEPYVLYQRQVPRWLGRRRDDAHRV